MGLSLTPEYILPPVRRKPGRPPKSKKHKPEKVSKGEITLLEFLASPEAELRDRYARTLDKDTALRELSRLRKICEIASAQINQRLVPDESKCLICKKILPSGMKVTMMVNVRNEESGTVTTHPLCSVDCVRKWNKHRMGLEELIK